MSEEFTSDFEEIDREHTKEETDKKCSSCGGVMNFDPSTGKLLCPYCGNTAEIEKTVKDEAESAKELDFEEAENKENCDWGTAKKTIICESCGAESIYDELQLANQCPYCGSNQVMEEKDVNTLAPGGVCVFKVDSKKAGENFKSWLKSRIFCPSKAKKQAKPESFKGVYIPCWTFDCDTKSDYSGQFGREREYKDKDGNTHTEIDWYQTSGTHKKFINDHLIIATERYDSDIFSRVKPFYTEDNLIYKPEYIAGFISERYSIGLEDGWEKAKSGIRPILESGIEDQIESEHVTKHVRNVSFSTEYSNIKYKYLLLPVWISSFKYKDKTYQFMVNGQTGSVGGKTPISPLRVAVAVLIAVAVIALIAKFLGFI